MNEFTEQVLRHIREHYDIEPDFLWTRSPQNAALRHHGTKNMNEFTEQVLRHIREHYDIEPDFLWARSPQNAALRHHGTKKWFGVLLMDTPRRVLGLPGDGTVDILDVKCDPRLLGSLVDGQRYLPGYHMNKEHWLTILLDGSVPLAELEPLIEASYQLTKA